MALLPPSPDPGFACDAATIRAVFVRMDVEKRDLARGAEA
jgi:hypothetical protein